MFISKALLKLTMGCRADLLCRCMGEIVIQVLAVIRAVIISHLLNVLLLGRGGGHYISYIVLFLAIVAAEVGMARYNQIKGLKCGAKIKNAIRDLLVNTILEDGPAFVQQNRTGKLTSALLGKVEALEPYYTSYLPCGISAVVVSVGISLYVMKINMLVGSICLLGFFIVILVPNFWNSLMFRHGTKDWELAVEFQADMLDNLQGMNTLKAFNSGNARGIKLERLAWDMHRSTMKNLSISQIESALLIFGATAGSTISIALAVALTLQGMIEKNEAVLLLFLITSCFSPVFSLIDAWHLGYHGLTAAPDIIGLLRKKSKKTQSVHKESLVNYGKQMDVSFHNIRFSYEKGQPVIDNVSMEIASNKMTALVGKSGSGKSTIINLLVGFYVPDDGDIKVKGMVYDAAAFRRTLGIVWQDTYLFYGTIADNISFGVKKTSNRQMIAAAQKARIHDFIMSLPQKYETIVGERGIRLSGGEKQRIAIARCFFRNPEILILDEATANLDGENELLIQKGLAELMKDKTVFIVAHRLSTIISADQIYVIDAGKVVEEGDHAELMQKNGLYRELMRKQGRTIEHGE